MTSVELAGRFTERQDVALGDRCPVERALHVIGTRSALLILREAFYGATKFDEFTKRVGITEAVAAKRLRELTDAGIFVKEPYQEPGQRTRYAYALTPKGDELAPIVFALMQWGDRHAEPVGHYSLALSRASTGEAARVAIRTSVGDDVPLDDLRVTASRRG